MEKPDPLFPPDRRVEFFFYFCYHIIMLLLLLYEIRCFHWNVIVLNAVRAVSNTVEVSE